MRRRVRWALLSRNDDGSLAFLSWLSVRRSRAVRSARRIAAMYDQIPILIGRAGSVSEADGKVVGHFRDLEGLAG